MQKRGFVNIIIIIATLVALGAIGATYLVLNKNKLNQPPARACTQEAKQCPDGSYVGRTGPNCEFAACPAVAEPPSGECQQDSGCKLLYSGCGCKAVSSDSSQTSYDDGMVCIRNSCMSPTPVTAVCQQNKCVRTDQALGITLDTSTWKTYKNNSLGFSMKFPSDWFFPSAEYNDPHVYSCNPGDDYTCYSGVEVQLADSLYSKEYGGYKGILNNGLFSEITGTRDQVQVRLDNLIPGARVLLVGFAGQHGGGIEFWPSKYYVFFEKEKKAFVVASYGREIEPILATFRLLTK